MKNLSIFSYISHPKTLPSKLRKNLVITSLPSYNMQIQWFPQYVCDMLDKTRKFIWRGLNDKGVHMVSWKKMTQPRKLGSQKINYGFLC